MLSLMDKNKGSMTLEAAFIVPLFLLFLVGLINFINILMVYVAMDHAVSETSKLIATHSFPLRDIGSITSMAVGQATGGKNKVPSVEEVASGSVSVNQVALNYGFQMLDKSLQKLAPKGVGAASEAVIEDVVKSKVMEYYPLKEISEDDFRLTEVNVFNEETKPQKVNGIILNPEDIAIVVVYKVKMPIPFFPLQEIILTNTAVERAWADG